LRWYLGYDLHEPLPDHSSLTRIRERFGLEVFRRFFERIVESAAPCSGRDTFVYDAQRDLYTCSQGEILHRQGHDHKEGTVRYRAEPSSCNECPLKRGCTKSAKQPEV
jgi:hypothetical protein